MTEKEALRAIEARLNEEWNAPELTAFAPYRGCSKDDIHRIVKLYPHTELPEVRDHDVHLKIAMEIKILASGRNLREAESRIKTDGCPLVLLNVLMDNDCILDLTKGSIEVIPQ